jgi:hypothetical protein
MYGYNVHRHPEKASCIGIGFVLCHRHPGHLRTSTQGLADFGIPLAVVDEDVDAA